MAAKYAPIAYLKKQAFDCDPDGEPYLMAPVEITFNDQAVALRRAVPGHPEVKRDINDPDLFVTDPTHYVDLPGNPREPGCGYERHARERMGTQAPVVYAHITTEEGKPGIAIQYWFYYYFNDFNDKHESDWEMMQLHFDADTVEEALTVEPVTIALSQHKGGETSAWDDPKLVKEDGHPVTYVARGSHGNYYRPGVWLGWGADGSGLGCDDTTGPSVRVAPEVVLVPAEVTDPNGPFAWSTFQGRWGEHETSWIYNGPKGPNGNAKWTKPFTWEERLRDSSLELQAAETLGPTPTDVFCGVVRTGSDIWALQKVHPRAIDALGIGLALVGILLLVLAGPTLRAAAPVYFRHFATFVLIGSVLIPIGLGASALHALLVEAGPTAQVADLADRSEGVHVALAFSAANVEHAAMLLLVGPAVIFAVGDIRAGRRPSVRRSYRAVWSKVVTLAKAGLRAFVVTSLLALTIVGLPWAIARSVRWSFLGQAVMLDGAAARQSLDVSARAVRGHWWRVLAIAVVLLFLGAALGPILGIAVMVLLSAPLQLVNGLSSVVYAFTHPFAVIGATVLYERLQRTES